MRAITYVLQKAEELGRPVAVNISIGDTYGAHDGTSLLERFIDAACEKGRNAICIGSGNEAVTGGHRVVRLFGQGGGGANTTSFEGEVVELSIAPNERSINAQIWKNYVDDITLELTAPSGERYPVLLTQTGKQEWITGNTRVLIYVSPPTPYSVNEEIFFDFIPMEQFIDSGIWTFTLRPVGENRQDIHFFLPNAVVRNNQTRFLRPDPYLSMTIPAFASRAITVGAYDGVLNSAADFSGRDREIGEAERVFFAADIKPDIAAPGVGITAPSTDGQYRSFTGTSFATPIVTGSAALLLEWGIVRGNDPFLYGEKLKAFLRKGARPLLDAQMYANIRTGYGALCVRDSLPEDGV
jgi:subtilisin family serine protease